MKLLRTRIDNFRILKEVEFKFADSNPKNLTVVRAANESGKTTLLVALQWGLFGDDALPDRGKKFRLSSLDASSGDRKMSTISVEIDYQTPSKSGLDTFRLIRSVTETVRGGEWRRDGTNLKLLRLASSGTPSIPNPDAHLRSHLPSELREVFFTDGDRALNFIEGKRGEKVKRVEAAIRSLLGFGVIEMALNRVQKAGRDVNQKIRGAAENESELQAVSEKLAELHDVIPELEERLRQAREKRVNLEDLAQDADLQYAEAVRRGNREDLENDRQAAIQGRRAAEREATQATRDHSNLFKSELLGKQFLVKPFMHAKEILDALHKEGKIPNQTIPVLEDRLKNETCICGEKLNSDDPGSQKRREHIQHLIEDSRNADEIQEKITALYYGAQDLLNPADGNSWIDEYSAVFARRQQANNRIKQFGEAESQAEAKIAQLPDVDVQQLADMRDRYREQAKGAHGDEIRLVTQIESKQKELKEAEGKQNELLRQNEKNSKLVAELEVAKDLEEVMKNALETMKTRELSQVSDYMNVLFLRMIGAGDGQDDGSQSAIINRAEITADFQIVVYGRYDQLLDPSQDLNGASKRALTIAFVLALTKVSEVEAPNVIDTPLGMTSGYVKTAVLQVAAQESFQLVLFLTHDEIKGCEDILDQYAGQVFTFTSPAHYPKILVNDPGVTDISVIQCNCNHHKFCNVCERREKVDLKPGPGQMASEGGTSS